MFIPLIFSLVFSAFFSVFSAAEVLRFSSYYGSHMVLQKAPAKAVVWGFGQTGAKVVVSLSGPHKVSAHSVPVINGIWRTTLNPVEAGGPYILTASQSTTNSSITLTDVLFGDIWLCSGQSNMAFTVDQLINATEELAMASKFPDVRIFQAALEKSDEELIDLAGVEIPWSRPTAELLGGKEFSHFSAVCWLFGRYLYETRKYPIGLVETCWGGTPVEAWSTPRSLHKCGLKSSMTSDPYSPPSVRSYFLGNISAKWTSSVLWNAMIHPLLNMTITGAIWYQGEANANYNRDKYNCSFPAMIDDWRMAFHEGSDGQTALDFPFGFVQLSTYRKNDQLDGFREIRWHQTADYGFAPNERMKNTFMAVAIDVPDKKSPWGSIHPEDKQDVAYRLVLGARAVAYGEKNVSFQGPFPTHAILYKSFISIVFNQAVNAIHDDDDDFFEICCSEDKMCGSNNNWLPVPIIKHGLNYVYVSKPPCTAASITAVRYLWTDWPCQFKACPIYSTYGHLPAPPFILAITEPVY
ncbi:sialate O-acetylesterase [Rhinichthys klamathensis goyatoka]|uniref:sialate O-acetylesterase n=1 Tax=Rhinichthys klamathensis goyatoka TaxID=3034132 RepID=UPI0024B49F14|nr:sialate O-acetylesterase [Rhinichthys klamathensis goyatoka]